MPDKKISQLTNLGAALGTDELPINRSNVSGKLTVSNILLSEATIRAAADGNLPSLTTIDKTSLVNAVNEVNAYLAFKIPTSYLDTDITLAADSNTKIATQAATRSYVLANLTPNATELIIGKAAIATQVETTAGVDDTKFITPLKLKTTLTATNYLTGAGTIHYLPKYGSASTLLNSTIQQTAAGNRILIGTISDNTTSILQVGGAIRQNSVTSKIAAYDAGGVLVSGGSGDSGYITKFTTSGIVLGNSVIREAAGNIGIGIAPTASAKTNIANPDSRNGLFITTTSINTVDGEPTYGIYNVVSGLNGLYEENVGIYSYALNSTGSNIGGIFRVPTGANNYAIKLIDGNQSTGKLLKCIDNNGNAKWDIITPADIGGLAGAANKLAFYSASNLLTYNNNVSIDATYPSITLTGPDGNFGNMTGYGFEARNTNGAFFGLSTASNTENSYIGFSRRRGNNTTELPPQSGDLLGQILFNGNDAGVLIEALATETQSVNSGSKLRFRTVRTGYTLADTKERLSIEGNGKVRINENYSLPDVDGAANDVMKTNGAGEASWGKVTSASTTGATNATGITVSTGATSSATFYITNGLVTSIGYTSW